jgi:hypothetical protein
MSAKIRKRHAEKHPALDRVSIEFSGFLQKLDSLLQVPPSLKRHRPREVPSIEISRAFMSHLGINPLRFVVLVGFVKRQCLLKKIGSLFVIHALWINCDKPAACKAKMHIDFLSRQNQVQNENKLLS